MVRLTRSAEQKALKAELLNRLDLLALQMLGPMTLATWSYLLTRRAQAEYAVARGFSEPVIIRMGRTVWTLNPTPRALSNMVKNLRRMRFQRFGPWTLTPDMTIDTSEW